MPKAITTMVQNLDMLTLLSTMGYSVRASKYPMSVDTLECTDEITPTVNRLGRSDAGTGHNNFLSGIIVQFDLTCSIKMWTEWERYHFQQIVSSQSTMHRITKMDISKASHKYVTGKALDNLQTLIDIYNADPTPDNYLKVLYNVPVGLKLTARVSTNYLQLKTMYHQRKEHRIPEWRELCDWMRSLPHSEWITGGQDGDI